MLACLLLNPHRKLRANEVDRCKGRCAGLARYAANAGMPDCAKPAVQNAQSRTGRRSTSVGPSPAETRLEFILAQTAVVIVIALIEVVAEIAIRRSVARIQIVAMAAIEGLENRIHPIIALLRRRGGDYGGRAWIVSMYG